MVNTKKQGSRTRKLELQETVRRLNSVLARTDQSLKIIDSKQQKSVLSHGEDQQLAAQRMKLLDLHGNAAGRLAAARRKLWLMNKIKSSAKSKHNLKQASKTKKAAPLKR